MNKKNIILAIVCIFSFFNAVIAQITISGTISDSNNKLVSNALVEIIDQKDSLNRYTALTDASGYFQISNITGVEKYESTLPNDFLILRNYPNPFNPSTIIYFELPAADNIEIKIFDILGREVRSLFSGFQKAGVDQINWDGRNNFNQGVSAGIYLCQLKTKEHFKVHKMVLLDGGTNSSGNISYNKLTNQNIIKPTKVNSRFNFTVKITGDSLDATYYRNLIATQDTILNLIVSKIINTETIGTEGGFVGNDDFKISIPAGAFDGNYNISLIKIEDDGAFGENTVTASFKLKGIPDNYSKPIKIIAKYSGELSNNSFLSVGEKIYDVINQDSVVFYNLIETNDSLGYLIGEIQYDSSSIGFPKISNDKNLDNFQLDHFLKFVSNLKYSVTQHFSFDYQNDTAVDMLQVATIFENAFEVVYNGLLYYTHSPNYDDWDYPPLKVTLIDMPGVISDQNYRNNQSFNVNIEMLQNNQFDEIQTEAVKRLFLPTRLVDGSTFWGDLPIYFWIEDLISDKNYDYPKANVYNFLEYGLTAFKGYKPKEIDILPKVKHGVGLSVFLKYLYKIQNYPIRNMRLFMLSQRDSELMDLIVQWWADFIKKYINNELYNLPDDYFITRAHAKWDINSEEDVSKTFTSADVGKYQDLSAKIFKINLNYADLDSTQNLKFKIIGPENNKNLSLILFSVANNKLEYIETTQLAEYEIINPKSYFDSGTGEFLAVLVNSNITQDDYLGQSEITLEMSIVPKEKDILEYKNCGFSSSLWGKYENKWADGSLHYWDDPFGINSNGYIPGKFTGNEFNGELTITGYYPSAPNSVIEVTLTAELNENHDLISNFELIKVTTFNNDSKEIRTEKVTGGNIPIYPDSKSYFSISGLNVCNNEITFFYEDIFYSQDGGENYIKIIEVACTEDSNLYLTFKE